jgi:peptidoglycan/LPS O-acetylase OafA/YrhL
LEGIILLLGAASQSIEQRLEQVAMRPSGFDFLRVSLAVGVIAVHTVMACYGPDSQEMRAFWNSPLQPILLFVVPSFFALSGFLVAGSLFRNSIPGFLALRALRIFPALGCELLISALIIGPAFTALPLREYFSNEQFRAYFLNLVGDVHQQLPGVFLDIPFDNMINFQLWTIPHELECYIALALLAIVGWTRKPLLFALTTLIAIIVLSAPAIYHGETFAVRPAPVPGRVCVLAFLCGVLLYLWRSRIPFNIMLFGLAAMLSWVLLSSYQTLFVAAIPLSYVTVWLGLQNPKRNLVVAGSDYSYGLYLYGAPVQQALVQVLPQYRVWYVIWPLTVAVAGMAAFLSWNLIEAQVLGAKTPVLRFLDSLCGSVASLGRMRRQFFNRP